MSLSREPVWRAGEVIEPKSFYGNSVTTLNGKTIKLGGNLFSIERDGFEYQVTDVSPKDVEIVDEGINEDREVHSL